MTATAAMFVAAVVLAAAARRVGAPYPVFLAAVGRRPELLGKRLLRLISPNARCCDAAWHRCCSVVGSGSLGLDPGLIVPGDCEAV